MHFVCINGTPHAWMTALEGYKEAYVLIVALNVARPTIVNPSVYRHLLLKTIFFFKFVCTAITRNGEKHDAKVCCCDYQENVWLPSAGIPVMIPTPLTRPSRKSILMPGRMYSGRLANSNRTFALLPGLSTIPSASVLAP